MTKTVDDYFADWENHVFGYGYGTGNFHILKVLRTFLMTCPAHGNYDYEALENACGEAVAWLLLNTLCHARCIEYGTSARYGWLTPVGQRLRVYVVAHTVDQMCENSMRDENYTRCYPNACNCGPNGYQKGLVCQNPFWLEKAEWKAE